MPVQTIFLYCLAGSLFLTKAEAVAANGGKEDGISEYLLCVPISEQLDIDLTLEKR